MIIAIAAIELFQGLGLYLFPGEFAAAAYDPIRPYFALIAAGLMVGGVSLLMMAKYSRIPWARRGLSILPAAPLVPFFWVFVTAHRWSGVVTYGLLAPAVLIALWRSDWHLNAEDRGWTDLSLVVLGLNELANGLVTILAPASMAASLGPLKGYLPLVGAAGLLGGTILLLSAFNVGPFRAQSRWPLVAVALPVLLAFDFAMTRHLMGVLSQGVWGVMLLVRRWRLPERRPIAEMSDDVAAELLLDPLPGQLEAVLEFWLWVIALAVVLVTALGGDGLSDDRAVAGLFVLGVSAYNVIAFRLAAHVGRPQQRVHWHLGFMTIATGMLVMKEGSISHAMLAPFLLTIPLAARVAGVRAGVRMLLIAVGVVVAGEGYEWATGHDTLYMALEDVGLHFLGIAAATALGVSSAYTQRKAALAALEARAGLQREVQWRTLAERIGGAIRSSLELSAILQTTVNELGRTLEVSRCSIRIFRDGVLSPPDHQYRAPGISPLPPDYQPQGLLVDLTTTRHAVAVHDIAAVQLPANAEAQRARLQALGIRSLLLAPLATGGELLGAVVLHQCDAPRTWTDDEIRFLEALAGQIAVAIAHGRAHQTVAESLAELQATHEELQAAHEELQAREEELVAQQEELQAQHEELVLQSDQLHQRQVELEEAVAAKSRFADIMEATTDLVAMSDENGRRIYMNRAGRRLIGYGETEEIAGMDIGHVHPRWAEEVVKKVAIPTAIREGVWRGESAYLTLDGREVPVSQVIIAHKLPDGSVKFLSNIARDISERKRVEAALRENEELFRSAFDSAPIGMALLKPDGTPVQVNAALCSLLGYTEPELLAVGRLRDLSHPEDRGLSEGPVAQLLAGETCSFCIEKRYLHKQGAIVTAEVSVTLIRDAQNSPRFMLMQVQDITERKQFESQLIHMANYDPLTDMYNRRRFEEALDHHLKLARRHRTTGALLFLDLDQFKYVNDSLGHQAGDLFLKGMSAMLRDRLRKTDIIARLGGDEFAILLPNTNPEQAQIVAEEIRKSVRRFTQVIAGQSVSTTCSIGIAMFPEHGSTSEELLSRADLAMYQAKEHGRNRSHVHAPEAEAAAPGSKLAWERRIREALDQDRLILYCQPIMDLKTNRICQYELLLRMIGDNGEIILPGQFLDIAERFGLIRAIDRWVVLQAIRMIARQQEATPDICLEVNLSGRAFDDPELLPLIEAELAATGIDPKALILEITETAAIANIDTARKFVERLQSLGCRFALDDFGSGFSSFYYLKHLPVDYLKIDGNFICNLPADPTDQHLVKAMVEVARGLGKKTVAEFVEHAETIGLLREFGVDYAQGFHIGRPAPMPEEHP